MAGTMHSVRNWILSRMAGYLEGIVSGVFAPLSVFDYDEPPPDKSLYMEAMRAGIDPATVPPGKLRQAILDQKAKLNT